MTLLGTLLRNRRPNERSHAWNQPNLTGPETLEITSTDFTDGQPFPPRHAGSRVGGENVSPQLTWSEPPEGTAEILLLIEDLDAPLGAAPAVHCLAMINEAALTKPHELESGALSAKTPAAGVTPLRSTIGRGYHGPEALKGHGPHRYVIQLFALGASLPADASKARPRALLAAIDAPILARGRITGTHER